MSTHSQSAKRPRTELPSDPLQDDWFLTLVLVGVGQGEYVYVASVSRRWRILYRKMCLAQPRGKTWRCPLTEEEHERGDAVIAKPFSKRIAFVTETELGMATAWSDNDQLASRVAKTCWLLSTPAMPRSISPKVIALSHRPPSCPAIHSATHGVRRGWNRTETVTVSSRKLKPPPRRPLRSRCRAV